MENFRRGAQSKCTKESSAQRPFPSPPLFTILYVQTSSTNLPIIHLSPLSPPLVHTYCSVLLPKPNTPSVTMKLPMKLRKGFSAPKLDNADQPVQGSSPGSSIVTTANTSSPTTNTNEQNPHAASQTPLRRSTADRMRDLMRRNARHIWSYPSRVNNPFRRRGNQVKSIHSVARAFSFGSLSAPELPTNCAILSL